MRKIGLAVAMDKEFGLLRGLMSGGRDVSCQGLEFLKENRQKGRCTGTQRLGKSLCGGWRAGVD